MNDKNNLDQAGAQREPSIIKRITPHIAKEVNSAKALYEKHRENPYHYYIGLEGEIIEGLSEDRYCVVSNNKENDEMAINILIANSDTNEGWPVSDDALTSLINLCADIAKRYKINLVYTGNRIGSITCHDMFCKVECPGPFLKSRLREIGFAVYNKNHGLPFKPQRDEGIFRVRLSRDNRASQKGVFKNFSQAVKRAKEVGLNVFDANGIEVFNSALSSTVTQWDAYDKIRVGDTIKSKEVPCYAAPGSKLCSLKIAGIWKTYIPALGGYIPNDVVSMVYPDRDYKSGEVDETANKVKVHGIWVCREFLLKKRNYL